MTAWCSMYITSSITTVSAWVSLFTNTVTRIFYFVACKVKHAGGSQAISAPSFFLWISESKLFLMQSSLFLHAFSGRNEKAAFSETELFNIKPITLVVHDCGAGGSTHTFSNFYKLRVKANGKVCVSFD